MFDLNEQELTSFKKAFDLFDKDGNGKINKEEITTVFKELNIKLQPQDIDKIIRQFDQNGDQCIEFEEFITVLTNNIDKSESQAWLVEVFQIIDQDCDGLLSKSQLEKVNKLYNLQIPEKEINQILQAFEGQEAGINYQQFASLLRNL